MEEGAKNKDEIELKLPDFSGFFKRKPKKTGDEAVKTNEEKESASSKDEELSVDFSSIWAFVKKHKMVFVYLALALILIAGAYTRTRNIPMLDSQYLVSPDDPYIFLRYSQYIADGGLPDNDTLRHYPEGLDPHYENNFIAYLAGYSLNFANVFNPDINMVDIASYLIPTLFVLSLFVFFFLAKEILNSNKFALIATAILAFSPAILLRTVAGFLEKEPVFLLMFFLSMLFFIKAYKAKESKKMYLFGALAGLCTGLAGFASGLFTFILVYISFFLVAEVILQKMNKHKFVIASLWFLVAITVISLTTGKYGGFSEVYKNLQFQLVIIALVFCGVSVLFNSVPKLGKLQKRFGVLPEGLFYAIIAVLVVFIGGLLLFGVGGVTDKIGGLVEKMFTPFGTDLMATSVSENQPPTFYGSGSSWWSTFGIYFTLLNKPVVIGITFLMFFMGAIILFYKEFKNLKWGKYFAIVFFIFSMALVFENFSGGNYTYGWIDTIFSQQWFFMGLFGAVAIIILLAGHKTKEFEKLNSVHLLVLVWYLVSIVAANSAVRLFFIMAIPGVLLAAYFIKWCYEWLSENAKQNYLKILPFVLAFIVIIPLFLSVSQSVSSMNPGLEYWYDSMDWIKENTPENAVLTHWWDYGYLVQAKASRATVGDPGNFIHERNFDIGGHVFNAHNNSEILWFADKYSLTGKDVYLLIPSEDVMKFVQIARLGSASPGAEGRETFFSVYGILDAKTGIIPNNLNMYQEYPQVALFEPLSFQTPVLEDFRIENSVYEGNSVYILRFLQPISQNETGPVLAQIYNSKTGKMEMLPVMCICQQKVGCHDLENVTGVPTCVLPMNGGYLNIPYKSKNILFTQLYLLDREIPEFEKVYDNNFGLDISTARGAGPMIRIYKYNWTALQENEGW